MIQQTLSFKRKTGDPPEALPLTSEVHRPSINVDCNASSKQRRRLVQMHLDLGQVRKPSHPPVVERSRSSTSHACVYGLRLSRLHVSTLQKRYGLAPCAECSMLYCRGQYLFLQQHIAQSSLLQVLPALKKILAGQFSLGLTSGLVSAVYTHA